MPSQAAALVGTEGTLDLRMDVRGLDAVGGEALVVSPSCSSSSVYSMCSAPCQQWLCSVLPLGGVEHANGGGTESPESNGGRGVGPGSSRRR